MTSELAERRPAEERSGARQERMGAEITALLHLARRLRRGRLTVLLPDGRSTEIAGAEPGPSAVMALRNGRLVRRYAMGGAVAFAESYLDGDWDSPDLAALLELLDRNADAWGQGYYGGFVSRALRRLGHALKANNRLGSRRNIRAHYDLGNEFFSAWLDPDMIYSSALFSREEDLHAAQLAKCRNLARLLRLAPGQRLLEIGTGWGGFAILAAKEFGARVTSLTISREQHELACRRVAAEGLAGQVEVRLQDYRDATGRFDRIASIEMFEAVGENYWPLFFRKLRERLQPGGLAGLQIITIADQHFDAYRRAPDFIQRYIFPGGMLPSPAILADQYRAAGFVPETMLAFGQDYARTLRAWLERFDRAWPVLHRQGFDERFRRIWTYYLAYCEAGFRTRSLDVAQTVLRPA